jgi:uncharacterized protein YraI
MNAHRIGLIPPHGTGIAVDSCNGRWCRVRYGCQSGWAGSRFLSLRDSEAMRVAGVAPDDVLNIRIGPGASYPTIGNPIPYNATGVIRHVCQASQADQTQWCLVTYNDEWGWVAGRYLSR